MDGVTAPSSKLRAVRRALESSDFAASIFVEMSILAGTAMLSGLHMSLLIDFRSLVAKNSVCDTNE